MKKSLLALAVLGAFAGVASAQSSVTLYGTIDLNGRYVKNDGSDSRLSLSQDGINSSQLGFRGIEDLGGGLKAGFVLLSGVNADTGTSNAKFWNRKATVSLMGGWGEVRLGRDYVPTFWNNTIFDAFGTNGLGDSTHVQQFGSPFSYGLNGANVPTAAQAAAIAQVSNFNQTFVRADNSIGYFLPANLGGFYGQFMMAASEGAASPVSNSTGGNVGRYIGGRLGYAAGPFDVAAAYSQQRIDRLGSTQDTWNIGGSWDFGFMKLMGYYDYDKASGGSLGVNPKENRFSISTAVPIGAGEIHASYSASKLDNNLNFNGSSGSKAEQFAVGYVYNLSKRTALYTTGSWLNNTGTSRNSVVGLTSSLSNVTGSQTRLPNAGGNSAGYEFGIRHFF